MDNGSDIVDVFKEGKDAKGWMDMSTDDNAGAVDLSDDSDDSNEESVHNQIDILETLIRAQFAAKTLAEEYKANDHTKMFQQLDIDPMIA